MPAFSPTKLDQQIERLKQRTGRHWSLREIAKEANVSPAYLILLKNAQRKNPSMEIVYKLSQFFHVAPEELLDLEENTTFTPIVRASAPEEPDRAHPVAQTLQICEQMIASGNAKQALELLEVLEQSNLALTQALLLEIRLTQASALIALHDFERCETMLAALLEQELPLYFQAKTRYMRGRLLYELDRYEQAIAEFLQAKGLADAAENDDLRYQIHYSLGICYKETGEYSSSIFHYELALQLFPAAKPQLAKGHLLMGLGNTHLRLFSIHAAIDAYAKARAIYEASGEKKFLADIQHNIARVEYQQGDYEQALQQLQESLELHQATLDYLGIANDRLEMALCCKELRRWELVLEHAQRAHITFETVNKRGHAARAQFLMLEAMTQSDTTCPEHVAQVREVCAVFAALNWPLDLAKALRLQAALLQAAGEQAQALTLSMQALDLYETRAHFAKVRE